MPLSRSVLGVLLASLLGCACSPTRVARPLTAGELRVGADAGGPMVRNIPLPLSSIHAEYGATNEVSVFGGIHTTTLGFQALQLDLGLAYGLVRPRGPMPGVTANLIVNPLIDFRGGPPSIYPETNAYLYWDLGPKVHIFTGPMLLWDPHFARDKFGAASLLNPSYTLGVMTVQEHFVLGVEGRWLNFREHLVLPQQTVNSIAGLGGIAVYLTASFRSTPSDGRVP
jgi:hypothetical protein